MRALDAAETMRLLVVLMACLAGATVARAQSPTTEDYMNDIQHDEEMRLQEDQIRELQTEQDLQRAQQPDPPDVIPPVAIPEPEEPQPPDLSELFHDDSTSQKIEDLKDEIQSLRDEIHNRDATPP